MKVLTQKAKLDEIGATAIFVVHDDAAAVRSGLLEGLDVPFPVLVDIERQAYGEWGMGRSSLARIWLDPGVWRAYAGMVASGQRLRRPGRDTLQLGGDFIVDRAGVLTYARPQVRDDRPPVTELIRHLRDAARRE